MLHSLSRVCMFAALCGLLWLPTVAWGQDHRVRHVQDDAKLFTQAAKGKADAIVAQIAERHRKELFIQTVKEGPEKAAQADAWARDRFNDYKVNGVYVVFCTHPKFYRIEIGNKTRTEAYFGTEDIEKLKEIIKAKQSADEMLLRIANYTLDTMNAHAPKKANAAPNRRPANVQQPVVAPRQHHESAMPPWVGWVCLIVAVLLVVWVIFAIIRAFSGMGAGGGYGGGYGYGGGGGGFLTGMLGGMFGAMAGMWMYNNFFGGHANYSTGDWGGGAGAGDAGSSSQSFDGDTDTGASGGGDDWGGGDAGGGDADAGGGDWGGGGDVGGDAGGGDAGGGCGGGGCGGGGD
jgi:hypothetical protein